MRGVEQYLAQLSAMQREEALAVIRADAELAAYLETLQEPLGFLQFQPRPSRPQDLDEQWDFCHNRDPVSFLIGGNAAGTTEAAAYKTALFCLKQQPPPRHNTPFWVLSETYDQSCGVCWQEKLDGHGHLPACEIDWDHISWFDKKRNYPSAVPLKPWPGRPGKNWLLEFKSYGQGRKAMQARSIGGFWFSEQFDMEILVEVLRGTREYAFAGGQFCEFTPIDPILCEWVEKVMESPPPDWRFYRANTELNKGNLASGWYEQFFSLVPDEMRETRRTGQLATHEGLIYPRFAPQVHVVDPTTIAFPPGCEHHMGQDWGASEEHPHTCLWGYCDGLGEWWIYDEYWNAAQDAIGRDHALEIMARSIAWGWPLRPTQAENPLWPSMVAARVAALQAEGVGLWPPGSPLLDEEDDQEAEEDDGQANGPGDGRVIRTDRPLGPSIFGSIWSDPSRPGEITEFARWGLNCAPASNDVHKGIDAVRTALKIDTYGRTKLHISARCVHLISELRKYRWLKGKKPQGGRILNPKVAKPVPLKRDDDTVDSLRYLIYSVQRQRGAGISSMRHDEYAGTPSRRSLPGGVNPASGAGRFVPAQRGRR